MTSHEPEDITVELIVDGSWASSTGSVVFADRVRGGNEEGSITITRGVADQQSGISPQTASFTLGNADGLFNDDNPLSPLYHKIPLNADIRMGVLDSNGTYDAYLRIPEYPEDSEPAQYAHTADKASLDITGDIDIRVEFSAQRARGRTLILCRTYQTGGVDRSWLLTTTTSGGFEFLTSSAGTFASVISNATTNVIAEDTVRSAVRVTLDVNNGAGGKTYTWYTADSIAGPWTTLETNIVAGTTSIAAGAAPLEIGAADGGLRGITSRDVFAGKIHAVEVYNGIAGTLVADFKPATDSIFMETTSWEDNCASPNQWIITGSDTRLATDRIRFAGQLGYVPLEWDKTGTDVYSIATASGVLAQLNSNGAALQSCTRRYWRLDSDVTDYWPCEDEDGATKAASAVTGGKAATIFGCSFGSADGYPGSTGMMTFDTASSSIARFAVGNLLADTGATTCIFSFTTSGLPASDVTFATVYVASGTVRAWRFAIGATGFAHTLVDAAGATVASGSALFGAGANPNGTTIVVCLQLSQEGGNVRWQTVWHAVGSSTFYTPTVGGSTFAGTSGQFYQANFSIPNANLAGARLGHVVITHALTSINTSEFANVSNAFTGELFGVRAQRLCAEEGVFFQWRGDIQATQAVGAQTADTLLNILTAGQKVAGGILTDVRDKLGIEYVTQQYLGNRRGLELSYSSSHLSGVPNPVNDLRYLVNDFTASRDGGSSARHEVTDPLNRKNTSASPDGAGRWEKKDSFTASTDAQTILLASRETFTGTWPQRRIPNLAVELSRSEISGTATLRGTLMRDVIAWDLGDPVNLAGLSTSPLPPDDMLMAMFGYTEKISNKLWSIDANTVPAGPFQVPIMGDYSGREPRMDVDDLTHSILKADITTTATSFTVKTDAASTRRVKIWVDTTSYSSDIGGGQTIDINIGGERIRVTSIGTPTLTGGYNEQTFTVTRSINGVVAEHTAGDPISLWEPFYLGME